MSKSEYIDSIFMKIKVSFDIDFTVDYDILNM